jgi:golgi SNAP receptor complex member 2
LYPSELYLSLDELERQLDIMDNLVTRETPAQREVWKRKILELREDARSIRRQGEHYDRMVHANVRQQRERDELLTRRRRRGAGGEHDMNNLAEEAQSLDQSQIMVGELLASGQTSLSGLVEQRQRLRGVKRVVLDIGNKLGLSNSTMRIIERRDITDAYLVFGGMIVTCIVIYFCWF